VAGYIVSAMRCTFGAGWRWYASAVKVIWDNRAVYRGGQRGESDLGCPPLV
jgi:hypothetical protein